jgi:undecaprenyl diphosphate synthase
MHVAIIMNGNSRWAAQRGLPPEAGRVEGVAALRNTVGLAVDAGVRTLTLYAICTPDSTRPKPEIDADLSVLDRYLLGEAEGYDEQPKRPVRISVIGNCGRLSTALPRDFDCNAQQVGPDSRMQLRIIVDYSAHDDVVKATWRSANPSAPENFDRQLREIDRTALPAGAVDLLVRTGGGYSQSAFMLWEVAYARLHYVDCLWPDFTTHRFQRALAGYGGHACSDTQVVSIA